MDNVYTQLPFTYECENSDTVVIFIHGILEGPSQFEVFKDVCIKNDHSMSAILLDGHGSTGKNFASSSKEKWIECVENEIEKHKYKYENIILVGHSMGALLSILSYEKYKDIIKAIILIATPMKVFVRPNIIISSMKIAFGIIHENDTLTNHAYKAFSVKRCSLITYIRWIPRYIDLFKLIYKSKIVIRNFDVKTLVVHSKKDELVSKKSLKMIKKEVGRCEEIIYLEKSGHFYYEESDLQNLIYKVDEFLKSIKQEKVT